MEKRGGRIDGEEGREKRKKGGRIWGGGRRNELLKLLKTWFIYIYLRVRVRVSVHVVHS